MAYGPLSAQLVVIFFLSLLVAGFSWVLDHSCVHPFASTLLPASAVKERFQPVFPSPHVAMQVVGRLFYDYYGIVRLPELRRSTFRLHLAYQDRCYHVDTTQGLPG